MRTVACVLLQVEYLSSYITQESIADEQPGMVDLPLGITILYIGVDVAWPAITMTLCIPPDLAWGLSLNSTFGVRIVVRQDKKVLYSL